MNLKEIFKAGLIVWQLTNYPTGAEILGPNSHNKLYLTVGVILKIVLRVRFKSTDSTWMKI